MCIRGGLVAAFAGSGNLAAKHVRCAAIISTCEAPVLAEPYKLGRPMLLSAAEPPPVVVAPVAVAPPVAPRAASEPDTEVSGVVVSPPKSAAPPPWSAKLNLDPRGVYQQSDTPYLRARPVDDCKLMAGGAKPGAYGRSGFASGIVCVKRF